MSQFTLVSQLTSADMFEQILQASQDEASELID
jgi:hypothetical protein